MSGTFQTGLPGGQYKDAVSGQTVTVDGSGKVTISLSNQEDKNIFAIYVGSGDAPAPGPTNSPGPSPSGDCDVSNKVDCGVLGTTQAQCENKGCCWKEDYYGNDPWCFYPSN